MSGTKLEFQYDDIQMGLNHVSDMASDLHNDLIVNNDEAQVRKAEQIAYFSWVLKRLFDCMTDTKH
ncbi:hypothetical protein [Vibrio sp. TRT 17S01]|uniref:hypothetical protein n=1 Tax=Vibrio sp. TRT 17S01 TaxID=3418505 RepID=UPI003CF484BC